MSRVLDALRRAEEERGCMPEQLPLGELLRFQAPTPPCPDAQFEPIAFQPTSHLPRVSATEANAHAGEQFRLLRYRLETWRRRQPTGKVLIGSAIPGEGKTMVATNLAETLAQGPGRVLLVDADLRRPGVHGALGLPPLQGLSQVLQGDVPWREAVRRIDPLGFCYLPAGRLDVSPIALLQSPRLKQLLAEAADIFEWVLVDSPPLLPFADSLYLAEASQGVLMVAREGFTPAPGLKKALDMLQGLPLVGVVLNAVSSGRAASYYYDYYHEDAGPRLAVAPKAPGAAIG